MKTYKFSDWLADTGNTVDSIGEILMDSIQPCVCTGCGNEVGDYEPDATSLCPECGGKAYGLETLMFMDGEML